MGPDSFDCAGLPWFLYYSMFNINIFSNGNGLSTTTKIMTNDYGNLITFEKGLVKDIDLINKGDILFFHRQSLSDNKPKIDNYYPGHCGVYIGDKNFIQASSIKERVVISNFDINTYWMDVLVGSKDLISDKKILSKTKK